MKFAVKAVASFLLMVSAGATRENGKVCREDAGENGCISGCCYDCDGEGKGRGICIDADTQGVCSGYGCLTNGGGGGDPHFMRWNGKRYSYHGACDLVMVHSSEFGEGKGLDLHVRTTIDKFYSFIERAAVKIGDSILEITSNGVHFNGSKQDLPEQISGYPISTEEDGAYKVIRIDLDGGAHIDVKIYKKFLSVNVAADKADFGNSIGLLGDFHTGAMLARDDKTIIELDDEFGAEWQVQADEPRLFQNTRSPQLPEEKCQMPAISASRGLRGDQDLKAMAEKACHDKSPDAFNFCVFDVMATGDIGMVGAW